MKCFPALCKVLIFIFLIDVASAGQTIHLEPTDENGINNALSKAKDSSVFLTVYLNDGVYEIEGPINIYSNTMLTGSPDAIIKVSSDSNQWFVGGTGIINHK
ncbi:glycosyl hydrolase family 28-related protein, partial [Methanosarcina mazei]